MTFIVDFVLRIRQIPDYTWLIAVQIIVEKFTIREMLKEGKQFFILASFCCRVNSLELIRHVEK